MSIARRHQMTVIERPIELDEISKATEVFLAGTAAEVTAVREIGAYSYAPGRITETLMQDYEALVQQSPEVVAKSVAV
jgi:branched-chain amino acid aminotransferase